MNYHVLPENAVRQFIDSSTVFEELARARQQALSYRGGMYWKRQGDYEYLVKTTADNQQQRLGRRTQASEAIYTAFQQHKQAAEARVKSLQASLQEAERMNRALKVGRMPSLVIDLLNAIAGAGLSQYFVVVGTYALYAYEAAAGVRIVPGALATQDVDLLWDARKRVKFFINMENQEGTVVLALRPPLCKIDSTLHQWWIRFTVLTLFPRNADYAAKGSGRLTLRPLTPCRKEG